MGSSVRGYEEPSQKKYNVFLSFSGKDVRKTFVDHLYQYLTDAGLNVYWDERSMEKGESIDDALKRAIKDSAICIIIFSTNYASSAWCLQELTHMCNSNAVIKPLFYDVQPHQVGHTHSQSRSPAGEPSANGDGRSEEESKARPEGKNETNPFSKALKKHRLKRRYPPAIIDEWGQSLKKVSKINGWTREITYGYEGRLVKQVVSDVIRELNKFPYQSLPKHHVHLERVEGVIRLLEMDKKKDVLKIGIWGLDGIGKTTVAKAVFNRILQNFDAYCFVSDVGTCFQNMDGLELREQLMRDMQWRKNCRFNVPDETRSVVAQVSVLNRTLVVFDDVVDSKQLDILTGSNWAGPGSRIIVTTPDKHVLNMAQINAIYKMEGLEYDEALRLFSWHAFLRPEPDAQNAQQSERIVEACGGMPLALEIVGGFLRDKRANPECWKEALNTPQSICHQKIFNELRPSCYDKLSFQEKQIFLQIACSYIGKETEHGIRHWKMLNWDPHTAIKNLELKSLISIGNDDKFMMHNLLRDMGQAIRKAEETGNMKVISSKL